MQLMVTSQQRQAARRELVKQIEQGVSVREARVSSAISMHRTTVYRLLKRVQSEGERALIERRHGHPCAGYMGYLFQSNVTPELFDPSIFDKSPSF